MRTRGVPFVVTVLALVVLAAAPAYAQDPSKSGELAGNLPFAVYLLAPLALALALLTAVVLGERGQPAASARRSGGVARVLSKRESSGDSST